MHDQVLTLLDDCIADLILLRDELAASRAVRPGERRATVLRAAEVAERFAGGAARAIGEPTLSPARVR